MPGNRRSGITSEQDVVGLLSSLYPNDGNDTEQQPILPRLTALFTEQQPKYPEPSPFQPPGLIIRPLSLASGLPSFKRLKAEHSTPAEETDMATFRCPECAKEVKFARSATWMKERHMQQHGPRPHQCDSCSQSFARKDQLTRHQTIHDKDKYLPCQGCSKRFRDNSALQAHLRAARNAKCRVIHAGTLEEDRSMSASIASGSIAPAQISAPDSEHAAFSAFFQANQQSERNEHETTQCAESSQLTADPQEQAAPVLSIECSPDISHIDSKSPKSVPVEFMDLDDPIDLQNGEDEGTISLDGQSAALPDAEELIVISRQTRSLPGIAEVSSLTAIPNRLDSIFLLDPDMEGLDAAVLRETLDAESCRWNEFQSITSKMPISMLSSVGLQVRGWSPDNALGVFCVLCGASLVLPDEELRLHAHGHLRFRQAQKLECDFCGIKFCHRTNYEQHQTRKHEGDLTECERFRAENVAIDWVAGQVRKDFINELRIWENVQLFNFLEHMRRRLCANTLDDDRSLRSLPQRLSQLSSIYRPGSSYSTVSRSTDPGPQQMATDTRLARLFQGMSLEQVETEIAGNRHFCIKVVGKENSGRYEFVSLFAFGEVVAEVASEAACIRRPFEVNGAELQLTITQASPPLTHLPSSFAEKPTEPCVDGVVLIGDATAIHSRQDIEELALTYNYFSKVRALPTILVVNENSRGEELSIRLNEVLAHTSGDYHLCQTDVRERGHADNIFTALCQQMLRVYPVPSRRRRLLQNGVTKVSNRLNRAIGGLERIQEFRVSEMTECNTIPMFDLD